MEEHFTASNTSGFRSPPAYFTASLTQGALLADAVRPRLSELFGRKSAVVAPTGVVTGMTAEMTIWPLCAIGGWSIVEMRESFN